MATFSREAPDRMLETVRADMERGLVTDFSVSFGAGQPVAISANYGTPDVYRELYAQEVARYRRMADLFARARKRHGGAATLGVEPDGEWDEYDA